LHCTREGIDEQAKFFQRDGAKESLVTEYEWSVTVSLRKRIVAVRNLAFDDATVGGRETN